MMANALTGAPWLSAMARVFEQAGAELYAVGGAVRNPLLGLPISDVDVCGPARPEAVCALCEGTPVEARLRAAHFGTVELHITDENGKRQMAEYTTWREDSYRCGHRPDAVRFADSIEVDALRRDFSVNALYQRVYPDRLGEVIDPTGGLAHLRSGVLHTVTEDPDRVLGDDGLRILRAARFQAELDLQPTPALLDSLRRNVSLLRDIACERLRDEWQKTLMADLRYPMLKRRRPATQSGLHTLHVSGAWPYLLGVIAYDEQAAQALSGYAVPTLSARTALLLHHADESAAADFLKRMRFSVREQQETLRCLRAMQQAQGDRFALVKLGMDALLAAREAFRALGDTAALTQMEQLLHSLEGKPMSLRELAINGDDLKPIFLAQNRPLREMGAVLDELWRDVMEGKCDNTREALLMLLC